jgi:hypothetical protein
MNKIESFHFDTLICDIVEREKNRESVCGMSLKNIFDDSTT